MLHQLNTRSASEQELETGYSFRSLEGFTVKKLVELIRYIAMAFLVLAYLVVGVVCILENHPMSTYLLMPILIIFLIATVAIMFRISSYKN